MDNRTDAELVRAAVDGDVESFGELFRRHYGTAVAIAFARLGDRHLAEDVAQEAFAIACREISRLEKPARFSEWIGTITRRTASQIAKRRKTAVEIPSDYAPTEDNASLETEIDLIRAAVGDLPESWREAVFLHYFSGLSYEAVALSLGITVQAVHGRLSRARRALGEQISRRIGTQTGN